MAFYFGLLCMISNSIRHQRCDDVLSSFCENGGSVFFTLTTPDVVDIYEIRKRWRSLRHYLVRDVFGGGVKYVMNYELHPGGHGWHIHAVFNRFIPLRKIMEKLRIYCFGRVDVRRVNTPDVAEYLTKHCLKAYRGVSIRERVNNPIFRLRLVNQSRGLPRLSDYEWISDFKSKVRVALQDCVDCFENANKIAFFRKTYQLAQIGVLSGKCGKEAVFFGRDFVENIKFCNYHGIFFFPPSNSQNCENFCKNENDICKIAKN